MDSIRPVISGVWIQAIEPSQGGHVGHR